MMRPCPACEQTKNTLVGEKNGFSIYRCECGTLYTGHLPTEEEELDYDGYYTESNLTVPAFVYDRLSEILDSFQPFYKTGNLLDVGFGAGDLLKIAKEKNWNAHGVEVSKPAVDHARAMGLEVINGYLQDVGYPDNFFDVVTASEIIEHCNEPESLVNEVHRILRPGGLFWATTPAAGGLSYRLIGLKWSVLSPPEHLQIFSRRAALRFMSRFSSVKIKTHGFNPSEAYSKLRNGERPVEFDRVNTGYKLNESLSRSPSRRAVKALLNNMLSLSNTGDSLKIRAIK